MATVIKVLNASEDEMNSLRDRHLSAEAVDSQKTFVRVFEVKRDGDVIDEPRENDLDDLQKNFEKKLDINNDKGEVLQISRGPHGGKPTPQGTDEHDPPSKFVRPAAAAGETHPGDQINSTNGGNFNYPTNTGYTSCFPNFSNSYKYVGGSECSEIPSGSKFMTAAEFFQEKGQFPDQPTLFSLMNPNVVYDEHGQIIQQNNKRKSSDRYIPQTCFDQNTFQIPSHASAENMIRFNPNTKNQNSRPLQFDLTYNNLPSNNTGFYQKEPNLELSNGRNQTFQNFTPNTFSPQLPQAHQQLLQHHHHHHQQQQSYHHHHQQQQQIDQQHQQQSHLQHGFYSNPQILHNDQWRNITQRTSPKNLPIISSKISTGNGVNSAYFTSHPSNSGAHVNGSILDKCTMKTFINEAVTFNSDNSVQYRMVPCVIPQQCKGGIVLPVRTDTSNGLNLPNSALLNSFKTQNGTTGNNTGSISYNNSSIGLSYESQTNAILNPILNKVPKSEQLNNQSEKQPNISQQTATEHQGAAVHQAIKTIPKVSEVKTSTNENQFQDFHLDLGFGLDEEAFQSLFEEFQNSDFDLKDYWGDDDFHKQQEHSETNLSSPPESYSSSIPDIYPDLGPQSLSNESDCQNPNSVESCSRQLESLENVIIHPDMIQSMFKDSHVDPIHISSFFSEISGLAVNNLATPSSEGLYFHTSSSIGQHVNATLPSPPICSIASYREVANVDTRSLESQIEGPVDQSLAVANYTDDRLMTQDEDGDNILHIAVINDKPEIVQDVLTRVKDKDGLRKTIVEAKNELGQTPLCLAVVENQPVMVRSLVDSGADVGVPIVSRKYKSFTRPLHFAASKGQLWMDCLRELLASPDIDVNSLDSDGKTPLLCAVKEHGTIYKGKTINSIPSIELLVKKGADLNKADGCFDMTALHYAISSKSLDLVSCLVTLASTGGPPSTPLANNSRSKGATGVSTLAKMLSAKTGTGYSALHLAVGLNMKEDTEQLKIIQLLLSKGADPSSKNSEGQLPRELTKNQKVIEILKGIGLRRKPSPPLKSPSDAFHHSPGTMSSHSPRSVTSQGRLPSTNGQFSPANHIPSPIQHFT